METVNLSESSQLIEAATVHDICDEDEKYMLEQSADDDGNALSVLRLYPDRFLHCSAYGWMENVGTHWYSDGTTTANVNNAIVDTLKRRRIAAVKADNEPIVKVSRKTNTNKNNARHMMADKVAVDVSEFDREPHLLNCQNGVVDLRTGKLVTSESSGLFTYCVKAEYEPDNDVSAWTKFLSDTAKDYDQIREWFQMACGYSITGFTNEECMFYLYGPTRSGKGTFTNALLGLLGKPLSKSVSFSMFTATRNADNQNFDLAPLKPSRFIAASESNKHHNFNEAMIKQITGNDEIQCAFKGKDLFNYLPQFKVWLSSNHPVKGDVDDDAFWNRIKIIEFPNSRLGEEDKGLKYRMMQPEYRNALLSWCVRGAQMWHNEPNGLTTPKTIKESTESQRSELDSIQRWLDECVGEHPGAKATNNILYLSYENWCNDNGESPKKARAFGVSMRKKGYAAIQFRDSSGKKSRGYNGIELI